MPIQRIFSYKTQTKHTVDLSIAYLRMHYLGTEKEDEIEEFISSISDDNPETSMGKIKEYVLEHN